MYTIHLNHESNKDYNSYKLMFSSNSLLLSIMSAFHMISVVPILKNYLCRIYATPRWNSRMFSGETWDRHCRLQRSHQTESNVSEGNHQTCRALWENRQTGWSIGRLQENTRTRSFAACSTVCLYGNYTLPFVSYCSFSSLLYLFQARLPFQFLCMFNPFHRLILISELIFFNMVLITITSFDSMYGRLTFCSLIPLLKLILYIACVQLCTKNRCSMYITPMYNQCNSSCVLQYCYVHCYVQYSKYFVHHLCLWYNCHSIKLYFGSSLCIFIFLYFYQSVSSSVGQHITLMWWT